MTSVLKTPPLQTATHTIDTLCGRLQSATLLEDRRAAILGLRSFAKQYPASVASGSLRELITTLRRDGLGETGKSGDANGSRGSTGGRRSEEGGDVDTIRLVLETLLMLFNPDAESPEASDEIAFFMADEFSMRQDNILLLLSLLDPTSPYADYYSRLYSVQLLTAICSARPERLQECILTAPLGVSRLVGILDDGRDAVRNAGLVLLVDLTSGANEDLRKIVAFEDIYGRVFTLIENEGGLAEAGITAQDCLSLLAHLIKGSPSNQTMFRESGCVTQMVRLLSEAFPPVGEEAAFVAQGRERAAWGLLQLLALFLEPGEASTPPNQAAFFRAGAAQVLVDLSFCPTLPTPIRILALKGVSALISSNQPLQESFAGLTVQSPLLPDEPQKVPGQVNGTKSAPSSNRGSTRPSADRPRTYIIEALLDLTLASPQDENSLRAAAGGLIQAYLANHPRIKWHFLQRAIAGHAEHEEAANVLTTLLHPGAEPAAVVFASWIAADLIAEQDEAKVALAAVKEGDEGEGEDVLTCIQALGSQLQSALHPVDERLVAAYAGLLTVYLWDFADGVNHLLSEGSGLAQALIAAANPNSGDVIVAGLSASLLGTVYEFSTKDSPIPRRTLAPLLTQKLGRSKYLDALTQLRRHPAVRDAELEGQTEDSLLNTVFVELFMTEYTRLRKAIDKDPGVEVLPSSAAEAGVDRDVLDELRQQLQETKDALSQAQKESLDAGQLAEQHRLASQKDLQTSNAEVERLRRINQAMQHGHETELERLTKEHEQARQASALERDRALGAAKAEAERQAEGRLREQGAAGAQKVRELEKQIAELGNQRRTEQGKHAETARQLEQVTARHAELGTKEQEVRGRFEEVTQRCQKVEREHEVLKEEAARTKEDLDGVKGESEKRQELVTRLTGQVKELREELKGREQELEQERKGYGELEKELEVAKKEAEGAEKRAKEVEDKLGSAETKAKEAEGKAEAAQTKLKEMESKVSDAERKAKEAHSKLEVAEQKAKGAEGKVEAAEKKAEDAQSKLDSAEKKAKDSESKVQAAEKKASEVDTKAKKNASESGKSAKEAEGKLVDAEKRAKEAEGRVEAAEKKAKEAESKLQAAQKKAADAESKASKSASSGGGGGGSKGANKADNKKLADLESQLSTLQGELAETKTSLEQSQAEQAASRTELDELRAAVRSLEAEVERMEGEVKSAREGEKGAKEELESMLLVMGDLEAKKEELRGKVKGLGGEVSEEEGSSDDDDEEEEEDEEDESEDEGEGKGK